MPYLDKQQKVVIGLQLAGAGLVSKEWQRNNVGIPDNEAMEDAIVSETIESAVLQLIVQSITEPEQAPEAEQKAEAYIEGGHLPHPLTQLQSPPIPGQPQGGPPGMSDMPTTSPPGGGGGGMPVGPANAGPGPSGQVMAPPLNLPPGSPVPPPAGGGAPVMAGAPPPPGAPTPAPPGAPAAGKLTLDQVIQAFQSLQGIQGQVFLVGEIVQNGETTDTIEVDITSEADRDTIGRGVPFPVTIKVVSQPPSEPYIEVTPGASTATQGAMPQPDEGVESPNA
jgi:hypothetical protein